MKYRIALAVSLFALSAGSYATTLCQEKEQNILKEISYAEKHQNQNRIDGLNKALSEVRANCSDSQLRVAAARADEYVRENPWTGVGMALQSV